MAYDRVVDSAELDTKLTSVADAIRSKTGKTEGLTLEQMPGEIEGIETGGVSEQELIMGRIAGTWPSGDLILYGEVKPAQSNLLSYSPITSLTCPDTKGIPGRHCFCYCTSLKTASFPEATTLNGNKNFVGCTNLTEFYAPKLTEIGGDQFLENTALKELNLPSLTVRLYSNSLRYNKLLEKVDLGKCKQIYSYAFQGCSVLANVVLKTESVCTLSNTNAFQDTPFATNGTGGTVYVPSALIPEYQTATNWSTLYAAGTCNFVAIEGSEYE